ncbi:MAG TPA: PAS domain S-box protein, partial [Pontiella sp.]|nr:PAS domain S-box protein [Pontiella sp.]
GKTFGVLGTYVDVTERQEAQNTIRKSEDRLRRAQKVAHVGNWEFDMEKGTVSASEEALRILGIEERQWTIAEIQKLPIENHRKRLEKALEALIENGTPYDVEFALERPSDGAMREIQSVAEYDPGEKLVFGVIQDITERKRAELNLARSEAKYRDLFEQSADAFLIIKDRRFVDCNHSAIEMLRCNDKEQLLNLHPAELSPKRQPDGSLSLAKADEIMQRMKNEKNLRFEWVHKRFNGELFSVEVSLTSITDSEGSHIIHTIWKDITDRKQAEESLIRLSAAIEQSPEAIVITDTEGAIKYINPAFETNTGYAAAEVLGQNPRLLKSGEHPPSFYAEMWEAITSGRVWEGRITNKRKNGTRFTEEATISPVRDFNGNIVNYVAVKRDISGELAREEELRQAQKMEAVGELAGGVAHDFNNILQGIIGFSELLRYSLDNTSQEYKNADEIHKSANQAAKLTQQLLTFSRKQAVRLEKIDINDVVYDSEALLHVLLGDQYEMVLDLQDKLPPAYTDQSQLTQIIMNLAVNARDAMPEGGRLSISTECIQINEADAKYIAGARPGRYLCLAITDTGSGMDAETTGRIFEPFFTTKAVGAGTGLGLAVIYGIVKQNKGWINVYSELGKGSCFKIYLPASESNEEDNDNDPAIGSAGRNARILLVEDDPSILKMVKKILGKADYTIIAAESAEDGLLLFDQSDNGFDLLMSDM